MFWTNIYEAAMNVWTWSIEEPCSRCLLNEDGSPLQAELLRVRTYLFCIGEFITEFIPTGESRESQKASVVPNDARVRVSSEVQQRLAHDEVWIGQVKMMIEIEIQEMRNSNIFQFFFLFFFLIFCFVSSRRRQPWRGGFAHRQISAKMIISSVIEQDNQIEKKNYIDVVCKCSRTLQCIIVMKWTAIV